MIIEIWLLCGLVTYISMKWGGFKYWGGWLEFWIVIMILAFGPVGLLLHLLMRFEDWISKND